MKSRWSYLAVAAAFVLPVMMAHAGTETGAAPAPGGAATPLAATEDARKASDAAFLEKVKAGTAKRLDFGDGVVLDLIKVGEGEDGYYLGRFEVTQEQYELVTGKNPSSYDGADRAKHPVELVSWNESMAFCKALNERYGKLLPEGFAFTLPTEAQWEKAAYAGEKTIFSGSDNLDEVGWYNHNSGNRSHAVGGKKANAWGFHDMSGNVWEWCLDPDGSHRARRGGGWNYYHGRCRVDSCFSFAPDYRYISLGFRVAASRSSK